MLKKTLVIGLHALVLWALCGVTIGIGRGLFGIKTTLIIHAVAAPVFAGVVSFHYFRKYHYTSALGTALIFLAVVVVLDAGLVAPVFEKSYAMFRSFLGTWLPFGLIFLATLVTGLVIKRKNA